MGTPPIHSIVDSRNFHNPPFQLLPAHSNAPFLTLHLPLSVPVWTPHFSPTSGHHHHPNSFTISTFINFSMESSSVEEDDIPWRRKKGDELAWLRTSANRKSQLAQFISKAMVGPRSWIGGIFNRSGNKRFGTDKFIDYPFTPIQEERLKRLQDQLHVPYDETYPDHQEALVALWNAAYPDVPLKGLISEQWKDMGWQGCNPSTDFRGCGFLALENLLYFVRTYPVSFHRLLFKEGGERAEWEYPFAVAGINVSFMLVQMLDLHSAKPRCLPGVNFVKLLGEDEDAFDELYCVAFAMMDAQWLAMRASYMEFNEVLQVTRTQLERELSLEDLRRIHDLPAFNLLYQ